MKKKFLSVTLMLAMLIVCVVPAYAAEPGTKMDEGILSDQEAPEIVSFTNMDSEDPVIMPRSRQYVDCTLTAGDMEIKSTQIQRRAGTTIYVNARTNSNGTSYIGLYDRSDGTVHWATSFTNTITGTLNIEKTGTYSLAIKNVSNGTIKYSGFYEWF